MTGGSGEGRFFGPTERAAFVDRPNRFVLRCRLGRRIVAASVANPGRMRELLLPGAVVRLTRARSAAARLPFAAVAVERDGHPVVLDTHAANDAARFLLDRGLVPGLEGAAVAGREVTRGRSRFDFLLRRGGEEILLEVKSCTLFGDRLAMFPDAVTARGRRHVEELAALSRSGTRAAVLFLVHRGGLDAFLPEYHVDPDFSEALRAARDRVSIVPLSLEWTDDLALVPRTNLLSVPWEIVEREGGDGGCYLAVLEVPRAVTADAGGLGRLRFRKGFYVYAGSARRGLAARVARHRRLLKRHRWHVDRLRAVSVFRGAFPIRTADDLECGLAGAVRAIAGWEVPGFGASDCRCPSHLFGFDGDPVATRGFQAVLQRFRIDRLLPPPTAGTPSSRG